MRIFEAVKVALRNAVTSFRDVYRDGYDPLTRDALTRTWNRGYFERRRESIEAYSLLLIDIDDFKLVNDRLGHSAGDAVLKAVAAVLRSGSGDQAFRVGGEEFAVLLRCGAKDALLVAERLCQSIRSLKLLESRPVTVSIGVGWTSERSGHEATYKLADEALYLAKGCGKDRVRSMHDLPGRVRVSRSRARRPVGSAS